MSLKEQKELFVSGLVGGTVLEIYNVTAVSLSSYLALRLIRAVTLEYDAVDFVLNCVTLLASITIYSGNATFLHYVVLVPAALYYVLNRRAVTKPRPPPRSRQLLTKKNFLTAYRAHMIIITNIAILAVDFRVFPRRFAKVETWGTSLMDLGVGSFVFSMGLVHSRSIIKAHHQTSASASTRFDVSAYGAIVFKGIKKSLPLLVLGAIRLVSVKLLDYQEHVSEYGIHWNFFITLGLLPIVLGILDPVLAVVPRFVVALAIAVAYEWVLLDPAVLKYVLLEDNRLDSLVTMNKEGMFSFVGYLSIFIYGQSFGSFVLTSYPTTNNLVSISTNAAAKGRRSWLTVSTTTGLAVASVVYQVAFYAASESRAVGNISRRLANLPYVLWVVSYNAVFLLGYQVVEQALASPVVESPLLDAINNNGLLIFLLGNLGTGLVNMSINTLAVLDAGAFGILAVYTLALSTVAIWLNNRKIYIKL